MRSNLLVSKQAVRMADESLLMETAGRSKKRATEEVLSDTDELAGLSLNPDKEYIFLHNNFTAVVEGVMVAAIPELNWCEKVSS